MPHVNMELILTRIQLWFPAFSMMLVSLISYIDRNTLALLAPTILRETHLTNEQYGFIVSGFSVAYMIGNPLWGSLLDRFGLRIGMFVAVACWTLSSAAHAFVMGFWGFVALRALLGFGEGATFPGGMRTASETLPAHLRSRGIALAYSGGSLGAVLTPLIVTPIAAHWGWRGAFLFTGLIGVAWLVLWSFTSRLVPHREKVAGALAATSGLRAIRASDPGVWAFVCLYALGALPLGFVIYAAALYLGAVRGLNQGEIGGLLWIPPMGWEVGYFFWGWISDRFRPVASPRSRRLVFGLIAGLSLLLSVAPMYGPVTALMLAMFFAMFLASGFVILSISYATAVFGTASSGLIAGIGAGSWSAVVAVFMPVAGRLFDGKRYDEAFLLAAVIPVVGYAGFLLLDRSHRNPA